MFVAWNVYQTSSSALPVQPAWDWVAPGVFPFVGLQISLDDKVIAPLQLSFKMKFSTHVVISVLFE